MTRIVYTNDMKFEIKDFLAFKEYQVRQNDYNECYYLMIMGIRVEDFLNRYFTSDQLKEILDDMGLSLGGTKKDRIDRIIDNWSQHNRDWYELLDFLEWGILAKICDDFNIPYSNYAKEETLSNKIEDNRVLDFRNQEKISKQKKSNETTSINIQGENINIGSHNKIEKKSENPSKIPKIQLAVAIVVGFFVILGVVWGLTSSPATNENDWLSDGVSLVNELENKIRTTATTEKQVKEIMIEFFQDPRWAPVCEEVKKELPRQQEEMKKWVDSGKDFQAYPDNEILSDLVQISQYCSARDEIS